MHDYYGPHLIAQTTDYDVYSKLPPKTNEFSWLLVDSDGNARWNGGHLNRQSRLSVLNQIRERFGVS